MSAKILRDADGTILVERFSPIRRAEHILTITTFVILVLTGFPQKFYDTGWARWIIESLGGLDQTRTIHRITGLVFAGHAVIHLAGMFTGLLMRRIHLSLLPTPQDLRDAWNNLRYYLGYRQHPPAFPKFDYRQKFEYIGIVLGGMVMVLTGLILLYPTTVVAIVPGEVIPAARVAHSNEALLALLVLVIWHVYGSHLSPDIFPMDKTIFTGYIPVEELEERHYLEYKRLFPEGVPVEAEAGEASDEKSAATHAEPAEDKPDDAGEKESEEKPADGEPEKESG